MSCMKKSGVCWLEYTSAAGQYNTFTHEIPQVMVWALSVAHSLPACTLHAHSLVFIKPNRFLKHIVNIVNTWFRKSRPRPSIRRTAL